ncbi:MAG: polyketide synthase dehydratase domain-containing protein, partial [Ignavibacteriaceae bacterium]|nr:polyketide synthase dehydratase domain-containing protein [Ignavibacteriaceae bacterium]
MKQQLIKDDEVMLNQNSGEFQISLTDLPYLADHAFQDMVVLPGSAYIEMAIVIYNQLYYKVPNVVKEIKFENIVLLSEKKTNIVFEIISRTNDELKIKFAEKTDSQMPDFKNSLSTTLTIKRQEKLHGSETDKLEISEFQKRTKINIKSEEFYKKLSGNGNQYGPKFQNIKEIWIKNDEALGKLISNSSEIDLKDDHFLHPSLLDSFTQLLSSLSESKGRTFVLNSIDEIRITNLNFPEEVWCKAN